MRSIYRMTHKSCHFFYLPDKRVVVVPFFPAKMSPEKLLFIGSQTLVLRTMRLENVRRFPRRQSEDEIQDTKEVLTRSWSTLLQLTNICNTKDVDTCRVENQLKFQWWYLGTKFDFES